MDKKSEWGKWSEHNKFLTLSTLHRIAGDGLSHQQIVDWLIDEHGFDVDSGERHIEMLHLDMVVIEKRDDPDRYHIAKKGKMMLEEENQSIYIFEP